MKKLCFAVAALAALATQSHAGTYYVTNAHADNQIAPSNAYGHSYTSFMGRTNPTGNMNLTSKLEGGWHFQANYGKSGPTQTLSGFDDVYQGCDFVWEITYVPDNVYDVPDELDVIIKTKHKHKLTGGVGGWGEATAYNQSNLVYTTSALYCGEFSGNVPFVGNKYEDFGEDGSDEWSEEVENFGGITSWNGPDLLGNYHQDVTFLDWGGVFYEWSGFAEANANGENMASLGTIYAEIESRVYKVGSQYM
jgi:hypothetical protein